MNHPPTIQRPRCPHRGFTLLEVLIVLTILALTTTLAVGLVSDTESGMRADRAARECVTAIRAARSLAMTTGNTCGVRFDTTNRTFHVYSSNTPATAVTSSLAGGGRFSISLAPGSRNREVSGVGMAVSLANSAASPYDLAYTTLGSTGNAGTITFTYGGKRRTVSVPAVGDPTIPD